MATDAERAWDLMASLRFCMLCTWTGDKLHARPMAALVRRHENAIYFFTDRGAQKDDEIARFPEVCIAFADPNGQTYVSVCGRAQIVQDRAKVKELWSLPAKAWWDDPDQPQPASRQGLSQRGRILGPARQCAEQSARCLRARQRRTSAASAARASARVAALSKGHSTLLLATRRLPGRRGLIFGFYIAGRALRLPFVGRLCFAAL